jgi:hypothetical protein
VPEGGSRSQFQLQTLHGGLEKLSKEGGAHPMAHDGLQVLDGLGGKDVPEIKALSCQRSVSRHVALDLGLGKADLENGLHPVFTLLLRERAVVMRGYSIVFMMV